MKDVLLIIIVVLVPVSLALFCFYLVFGFMDWLYSDPLNIIR